jgi:cytoskeletal protein CcmA (bactofilin family)
MRQFLLIFLIVFLAFASYGQNTTTMTPFLHVMNTLTADSIWARAYGNLATSLGSASVMDFGGTHADSVDNATAIQAAITYAQANGLHTIYFPSGNYWTSQITLSSDDSLAFVGQEGTVIHSLVTFPVDYATVAYYRSIFYIVGCDYLTFDNLSFNLGASTKFPMSYIYPIFVYSSSGNNLHSKYIRVKNCTFTDCAAIEFWGASSDTSVWGADISRNNFFPADTLSGIQFYTSGFLVNVTNNSYYGNDIGRQFIVGQPTKAIVANNKVYRPADSGIYLSSPDVLITNNYIEACGKDGIKVIHSRGSNIIVNNNIVNGVGRLNRGSNVGYNFEASRVAMTGNIFTADTTNASGDIWYWKTQHGLKLGIGTDSSQFSNNQFYGVGLLGGTNEGSGVRLSASVTECKLSNNIFTGFEYGVVGIGNNVKRIYLDNNYFYDIRLNNIRFADTYTGVENIIIKNNIHRDSNYPIIVKNIDSLLIESEFSTGTQDNSFITDQGGNTNFVQHNNERMGNLTLFKNFQANRVVVNDSIRVEKTALIKGKVTTNDSLANVKGIRTEGISLLKGTVTAKTKVIINDSLRVEETSLLKGAVILKNAIDLNHGTTGVKITNNSDGALTFLGLGNGADENVTIDLDSKTDTVYVSSGTGASTLHYVGTISGSTGLSTPGKIVVNDSLRIGENTVKDNVVPALSLKGDADSDLSAITRSICTLTLAGNADPTLAYWQFSSTANRFWLGGATDYVTITPSATTGMLNIVAGSAGNWNGITFSGAGFNDVSDYWIYMDANTFWRKGGALNTTANINTTGNLQAQNGNIINNATVSDIENPTYTQKADFDSDAGVIQGYDLVLQATPNANPALGKWSWTSTGGLGYSFDKTLFADGLQLTNGLKSKYVDSTGVDGIVTNNTLSSLGSFTKLVVNDSLRVEETTLLKGKVTTNDSLVNIKGIRTEGSSLLKGTVTAKTKLVVNDSLRIEETTLIKGKTTVNDSLVAVKGIRTEGLAFFKDKAIINDSIRVERTSLLKGKVTGNDSIVTLKGIRSEGLAFLKDKAVINDSLRVEKTLLIKGKGTFNDSLVTIKGFRNESISTLKGDVTARTKVVINDSLRVEETALIKGAITANKKVVVKDSLRVEKTSLLKGKLTTNDSLVNIKGIRTEGLAFLKDKAVINDSLRVEKTALIKGKLTTNDSLVTLDGFRTEGRALLKDKAVVSDSFRVGLTSVFKGVITAAGINSSSAIATTANADITTSRYFVHSVAATLTAATPGIQGDAQLSKEVNEVSTVTNTNDAITLPNAAPGREIFIINNGVNTLEIWPASGDNLGAGVNTATTLISGANITFIAYDTTNWEVK